MDVTPHEPEPGPYTWADFVALDEDDLRELIDGELVEVEVPTKAHERIAFLIAYWLEHRAGNFPKGQDQGLVEGRPDLVVEVSSPSSVRDDRVTKLRWYATLGVPEYWIVDPAARTLERLVLDRGLYSIADALAGPRVFRPSSFEGLEIRLARLWEVLDELGPA